LDYVVCKLTEPVNFPLFFLSYDTDIVHQNLSISLYFLSLISFDTDFLHVNEIEYVNSQNMSILFIYFLSYDTDLLCRDREKKTIQLFYIDNSLERSDF
jgi:hypothetical protein